MNYGRKRPVMPTVYGIRGHRLISRQDADRIRELLSVTPPLTSDEVERQFPGLFKKD